MALNLFDIASKLADCVCAALKAPRTNGTLFDVLPRSPMHDPGDGLDRDPEQFCESLWNTISGSCVAPLVDVSDDSNVALVDLRDIDLRAHGGSLRGEYVAVPKTPPFVVSVTPSSSRPAFCTPLNRTDIFPAKSRTELVGGSLCASHIKDVPSLGSPLKVERVHARLSVALMQSKRTEGRVPGLRMLQRQPVRAVRNRSASRAVTSRVLTERPVNALISRKRVDESILEPLYPLTMSVFVGPASNKSDSAVSAGTIFTGSFRAPFYGACGGDSWWRQ